MALSKNALIVRAIVILVIIGVAAFYLTQTGPTGGGTVKVGLIVPLTGGLAEQNAYMALSISYRAYVIDNGVIVMEGSGKDLLGKEHVRKAYLGI